MANNIDVRTSLALSKNAVVVTDIGSLVGNAGVPLALDKGDNQVVVLFSAPCCHHHGSRTVPQVTHPAAQFNTAEHIVTVAGCRFKKADGKEWDALRERLPVGPSLQLTYGQVIGLGGDFYGDPENPVCEGRGQDEQIERFGKHFGSLEQAPPDEVKNILRVTQQYEFGPIADALRRGHVPSGVYVRIPATETVLGTDEDKAFDQLTGGDWGRLTPLGPVQIPVKQGRYLRLASKNFDHFGVDAITCYMAGHILAQRTARDAKRSGNSQQLLRAYAINAFADHFLTDLFAAGHMRVPRRALFQSAENFITKTLANLCVKRMHDEDNKFGLWVENYLGDKWVAYGDARYRDLENTANRRIMKRALQQSMDEVWDAFQSGQVRDLNSSQVVRYLPKLITEITVKPTAEAHRNDPRNWAPLFWQDPGDRSLWRRNELQIQDPTHRDYYPQRPVWDPRPWGITSTAIDILPLGSPHMPAGEYAWAGLAPFPNEAGPSGEFGWPPEPRSIKGSFRVQGATGPNLQALRSSDWQIDGTPGPQ